MTHLSDTFMLDMLAKVQPIQAEILKSGRSAHVDAHVHEDIDDYGKHHIDIDVTIFDGNTLVKSFDFSSLDSEEQCEAELSALVAYVHTL